MTYESHEYYAPTLDISQTGIRWIFVSSESKVEALDVAYLYYNWGGRHMDYLPKCVMQAQWNTLKGRTLETNKTDALQHETHLSATR